MKSYTNTKLRKKLQNKGIILDEKKQHFDKYSYYQVINAYKNIFSTSIENNKNNECMKYTYFLFDRAYTKYTGIDKKYFDKLMNNKEK